jgi:hypothetical protein
MLSFPGKTDRPVTKQYHPTMTASISESNAIQGDVLLPRLAGEEHVKQGPVESFLLCVSQRIYLVLLDRVLPKLRKGAELSR